MERTKAEKVKKLMELVPTLVESNAASWFPFKESYDWGSGHRKKVIQAVKDIESGIAFTPLYEALR